MKIQTTPAEQRLAQRDSTDHAALMAASLAAIFAVVAAPGRWDRFSMLLGLTLLGVLFGFFNWKQRLEHYRQEPASRLSRLRPRRIDLRVFAFAGLVGLCSGLATAWPAQLILEEVPQVVDCQQTDDVTLIPLTPGDQALKALLQEVRGTPFERQENCISGAVTGHVIPWVWIIVAVAVYGWLLDLYPRRGNTRARPPSSPRLG